MTIAQWTDDMATGLCEIDCQHKALIKIANGLHEVLSKNKGKEVVSQAASFLLDFVSENFQNEERIMQSCDYPSYQSHKTLHDEFVENLKGLIGKFNNTGDTAFLINSVQHSIVKWLLDHFASEDKKLAEYVMSITGKRVA